MQYLRRPIWRRYAPFAILILLDGWLLFGFSIVEGYPSTPAGPSFFIPLILALTTSAWFISRRPGIFILRDAEPDEDIPMQDDENTQRGHNILIKVLAGLTFFAAAFLWMMLMYRLDGFFVNSDTYAYARVAEQPLLSSHFWAGERPFTIPLLFKLLRIDTATLDDPAFVVSLRAKLFTQFQALLSLASFILLGLAASTHIRNRVVRTIVPTICVLFGMTIDVAQWNRMLLSESTSLSLAAIVLALCLVALHTTSGKERSNPWLRAGLSIAIVLSMTLFSFTQDVNAYMFAAGVLLVLIVLLVPSIRRLPASRALLMMTIAMSIIAALQFWGQQCGGRWLFPLSNVMSKRIFTDTEAIAFFEVNGAPIENIPADLLPVSCTEECEELYSFLEKNPDGQALLEWIREHGKPLYIRFLFQHPAQSLQRPLADMDSMVSPDSTEYRQRQYVDPPWLNPLRRLIIPQSPIFILLWSLVIVAGSSLVLFSRRPALPPLIPAIVIILSFFLMFVIWHSDGIELERHVTQASLQLKLSLWLGSGFLLDILLNRFRPASSAHNTTPVAS